MKRYMPDVDEEGHARMIPATSPGGYVLFTDTQAKSLADERRIADLAHHLEVMCGCVREGHAHELRLARECLAALRVGDAK